jgi:hypothetical protein
VHGLNNRIGPSLNVGRHDPTRTPTSAWLLETPDPKARDKLRWVLICDLIDFLVLHKEERPKALRLLGEIEAVEQH